MKPPRIYLDTSVVGGCEDEEFAEVSRALLEQARSGGIKLLVSELLLMELARAPEAVQARIATLPPACVEYLTNTAEARTLQGCYAAAGIVGPAQLNDALHVALATVAGADVIASWNFKHIVRYDKIRLFNAVNLREGYRLLDIRSPLEIV
jgi:predicted nucleic acid-binding protein